MKLLYTVILIICGGLKWTAAIPLKSSLDLNSSKPVEELVKYYDQEYDLLTQEVCAKLKNITDEILKDAIVQKTSTLLMDIFKKNLTEFQLYYPYFKRFGQERTLMLEFSELIQIFYYSSPVDNNKDFLYIQQLLKKWGYSEIRDKYTEKFQTFVQQKFLVKFEELQAQIAANHTNDNLQFLEWISFLKKCQDYECFLIDFNTYRLHADPFSQLSDLISRYMVKVSIVRASKTNTFAHAVLKDRKLSQLSPAIKQQLTKNLQDIIKLQENISELSQLIYIQPISYYVLYKFDDYASISSQERQLIRMIFKAHGYESTNFGFEKDVNAESDYIRQYEKHKTQMDRKQLAQLQGMLEALDRLANASNLEEKTNSFESFIAALK